jgi:sulfatase-like protein
MSLRRGAATALYPIVLALAFVLDEAASNGVAVGAAPRALIAAVLIAGAAILVGVTVTRSTGRGALLALAMLFVVAAGDGPTPLFLALGALVVLYIDLRLARDGRSLPWSDINRGLTAMSLVLVILVSLPLLVETSDFKSPATPAPPASSAVPADLTDQPDIFVVLLDGFGRTDVLAADYGHDAQQFVRGLMHRGFSVADRSRSNYATTGLVLTSMLNAAQLTELGFTKTSPLEPRDVHPVLEHNRAFEILRRAGYETVAFSSGYELVSLRTADRFVDTGEPNELELSLVGETVLEPLVNAVVGDLKSDSIRARAKGMVPAVTQLAAEPHDQPRFVFVHFPLPHPPFVLGASCEPIDGGESIYVASTDGAPQKPPGREDEEIAMNAQQVACAEKLATAMVDGILKGAGDDAVIIVMSDHGPESRLNWFDPQLEGVRERLRNFFAARTPGHDDLFPEDVTPVNVLPTLFRAYLGVELPTQPDTSYFKVPGQGLVEIDVDR